MTWEDFKKAVEEQGVQNTDEIEFIDVHMGHVMVVRDDDKRTVQVYDEF